MDFSSIKIVLIHTTHPGNIGATARAMKNMGFSELALVQPNHFPSHECTVRAAGADEILQQVSLHDTLAEAIADCELVFGTSARHRKLAIENLNPRELSDKIIGSPLKVAIVFGRERSGLTNEELALCHYHIHIPTVENFSSLNLSQAVQVICYELRMSALLATNSLPQDKQVFHDLASQDEMEFFYAHLESTMREVGFLKLDHPKKMLQRLRRLFNRVQLEKVEVNILRGFLTRINRQS